MEKSRKTQLWWDTYVCLQESGRTSQWNYQSQRVSIIFKYFGLTNTVWFKGIYRKETS